MRSLTIAALAACMLTSAAASAADAVYSTRHGAIKGYDPVAYFTEGKPMKGTPDITAEWNGATWHFVSERSRAAFEADPERYAPQYGGYCAYAVSYGSTAKIEPDAWRIVDGKLYLNYDANVQKRWEADIPGHIAKADANWPGVLE